MPHSQETKRLIDSRVNGTSRTSSNSLSLARSGTDQFVSDAKLNMIHTRITLGADLTLVSAVDNAAKGGGAKLFDFPAGYVTIHNARIEGTLSTSISDLTSTAGEIGLGTVVGTGAVAVLGGTSTFEDILEGARPALGNMTAGNDLAVKAGGTIRTSSIGTFSAAAACFLNLASTWGNVASAGDVVIKSGAVIDIYWSIAEA